MFNVLQNTYYCIGILIDKFHECILDQYHLKFCNEQFHEFRFAQNILLALVPMIRQSNYPRYRLAKLHSDLGKI